MNAELSEIPELPCSAAQSASYAQRALEARSNDEMEEAVLRTARARAEAEESESRAATAAALATAHQEVSASQADVAEQVRLPLDPHLGRLRLSGMQSIGVRGSQFFGVGPTWQLPEWCFVVHAGC